MYNATFGVMKIAVRRRIGETRAGTFRERAYEGQADGAVTDEIGEAINDAQLFVARDIYDPDTNTLERRDTEIPIVNGLTFTRCHTISLRSKSAGISG